MEKVTVRREEVNIPTYEIQEYDKNPMFLERRVYQGSSGRVYPHPVCEGVADQKTDHIYQVVFLENEYLLVMILPELGGRIQRLYDKTNGYDAVYYNEVIKPALVGLAGPWISGGIEFNWPQHHRPSTFDPVDCRIEEREDGSATVWVGETEKMFHTRGMAGFTLYPGKAYLEIRGRVYNPTDRPQTFLWWANPAVPVNDHTYSVFPPDVRAVVDHGKRDVSSFPIARGTYYKVDYSAGVDISRYRNIPVPTSYMAAHSDYDFIGNYDEEKEAGLLHVADHHISPGKKQWTWGNGSFGQAWDRNLTDENGPYIELMTGVFTDNQPDFTFLKPYEEKNFVQYFLPYKGVGAVKNASRQAAVNLEEKEGGLRVCVYAAERLEQAEISVREGEKELFCERVSLSPEKAYEKLLPGAALKEGKTCLSVRISGRTVVSYLCPLSREEELPAPAQALPEPEELETAEKLFLAAVHLEQYRHATRSPEPYYLEGLKRDPSDIRLNQGYGKYLYGRGLYEESEAFFRRAVQSSVWKNPNPYDCEPFYNLGLALKAQGKKEEAFDAFYKAVWDGNMQGRAFYQMACLCAGRGAWEEGLEFARQSLARGIWNPKARNLETALLRHLGRSKEAVESARKTAALDALDFGCRQELAFLGEPGAEEELEELLRGDGQNVLELMLGYREAGLKEDAEKVLEKIAPEEDFPMAFYYRYELTGDPADLAKAEACPGEYCFPNRLEDMEVLVLAAEAGGMQARYYLGNLLYDKGRWQEAAEQWEICGEAVNRPAVWRNLSLAYYNKEKDGEKAKRAMERAFSMAPSDPRIFFELDQLYRALKEAPAERLSRMEAHRELLEKRDDLYTEYITLLNLEGKPEKALNCMQSHRFHPWEGGEGKITAQYRESLMQLADKESKKSKAIEILEKALE